MKTCRIIIALSILSTLGCMKINIAASGQRMDNPQHLNFENDIAITTWGAITINKVEFFPSSFQVKFADKNLYIDPVEIATNEKADYIFITHSHPDHLSLSDIRRILKRETKLVCPKSVGKKVKELDCQIMTVKPGEHMDLIDMQCDAVPAYNTKPVFLWLKAHPKSKEYIGYILTMGDVRLYHAGDTDNLPELSRIRDIDIAFIPIGGDNLTMNIDEAAQLANAIKPKTVIPMHFEPRKSKDLQQFRNLLSDSIEVKNMNSNSGN